MNKVSRFRIKISSADPINRVLLRGNIHFRSVDGFLAARGKLSDALKRREKDVSNHKDPEEDFKLIFVLFDFVPRVPESLKGGRRFPMEPEAPPLLSALERMISA